MKGFFTHAFPAEKAYRAVDCKTVNHFGMIVAERERESERERERERRTSRARNLLKKEQLHNKSVLSYIYLLKKSCGGNYFSPKGFFCIFSQCKLSLFGPNASGQGGGRS
jgi:hypothetical protein